MVRRAETFHINSITSMDWTSKLPERLTAAAYRAGGEYAWSKKDALDVVNWLSSQGEIVCAVEVWLPTKPGPTIPTPFVYQWSIQTKVLALPNTFNQNTAAMKYISEFHWDEKDAEHLDAIPYFNLTV